jgi:hypothetical protein
MPIPSCSNQEEKIDNEATKHIKKLSTNDRKILE